MADDIQKVFALRVDDKKVVQAVIARAGQAARNQPLQIGDVGATGMTLLNQAQVGAGLQQPAGRLPLPADDSLRVLGKNLLPQLRQLRALIKFLQQRLQLNQLIHIRGKLFLREAEVELGRPVHGQRE